MRTRFAFKVAAKPLILSPGHRALIEDRTMFPSRVRSARDCDRILIPGEMNSKIGGVWSYYWPGVRIFSLSLEERATCPRTCLQWRSCYGNRQRFTIRVRADQHLMRKLEAELAVLAYRFGKFSIRLHQLGDFYSVEYTRFWLKQVERFPGLRVFGFTARARTSPIGRLIEDASAKWDRVRIRFSNDDGPRSSRVIEGAPDRKTDGWSTCLAELGTKPNCAECGACLKMSAQITFDLH